MIHLWLSINKYSSSVMVICIKNRIVFKSIFIYTFILKERHILSSRRFNEFEHQHSLQQSIKVAKSSLQCEYNGFTPHNPLEICKWEGFFVNDNFIVLLQLNYISNILRLFMIERGTFPYIVFLKILLLSMGHPTSL